MHPRFPLFGHHHHHPFRSDLGGSVQAAGPRGDRRGGRSGPFRGHDDGFGGPHGRFGGRVFRHGELKLVLLALIAEQPRHGYELIRTIEEMFDGAYAPSPGAVYPTLTMLEEMGHARVETSEGNKKRYRITAEGSAYLEDNRLAVEAAMTRMEQAAKMFSRMAAPMAIREAMHTLKHALRSHAGPWTPGEARRVLGIIKRAADEILGGRPGGH